MVSFASAEPALQTPAPFKCFRAIIAASSRDDPTGSPVLKIVAHSRPVMYFSSGPLCPGMQIDVY